MSVGEICKIDDILIGLHVTKYKRSSCSIKSKNEIATLPISPGVRVKATWKFGQIYEAMLEKVNVDGTCVLRFNEQDVNCAASVYTLGQQYLDSLLIQI